MLNTNYLYIMCHKYSHDMHFEASAGVVMEVNFSNVGFTHVRLLTLLCFWSVVVSIVWSCSCFVFSFVYFIPCVRCVYGI